MLYSLLYGSKTNTETISSKAFKVAIQTEHIRNNVPQSHGRVTVPLPNIPCSVELSHGDDLMLCEASKMVEDMINSATQYPIKIKTYPRKRRNISEALGSDSRIFQNIVQLSNIYSQISNSSFENGEQSTLCINCPEVDPDAQKFEFHFNHLSAQEDEDIFSFYNSLEIKDEPKEVLLDPSASLPNVPDVNLHDYIALDESHPNWYDIYSRIDNEILTEKLNNDSFLNVDAVTKKFYIKTGDTLRLVCISVTDVPNNCNYIKENSEIVEHKLFHEIDVTMTASKRKYESENEERCSSKKHLRKYRSNSEEGSPTIEYSEDWNIRDLLDEDDTFVNAIKLEPPFLTPKKDLVSITDECRNALPDNFETIRRIAQIEKPSTSSANNKSSNEHLNGFQTGHGKPIDLPKNRIYKKYLHLYENMNITPEELFSTKA